MSKKSYTLLEYLVTIENKLNNLLENGVISGGGDNSNLITEINNLKTQFQNIVNEIEQARGGNTNLNNRLNNFSTQLQTISQRLDNIAGSSGSGSGTGTTIDLQQIDERINLKLTTQYKANPIEPLNIVTSYLAGDNQPTHPSVKFFPDGWNGHNFWMAYTPYPNSNDNFENPCITFSDDGINWSEEGITNPIENKPSSGYNSDTHLVYNNDTNVIECWYREVIGGTTNIKRKKSNNGLTWQSAETLHSGGLLDLLSPAIIYDEGKYKIWVVYRRECLKYYESTDGTNWQYIRDINVTTLQPNWKVWHIDIIRNENGEYEFVGCYQNNGEFDQNNFIFYAKSKDNITYSIPIKILGNGYPDSFDELELYRPCLCIDGIGNYRMYYGAQKTGRKWSIGLVSCRDIASLNNLLVGQNSVIEKIQGDIIELYKLLENGSGGIVTVPVTSVTLNKSLENLVIGKTLQLTATVEPQSATNKTVSWSSSNPDIVSVNNTGLLTAHSEGEVTITCVSNSNPNAIATCTIKGVQAGADLASLVFSLKSSNYTDGTTWIETVNNKNAVITGTVTKNESEILFTGNIENYFESDVSSLGIENNSFALEWYGTLGGGSGECIIVFGNTSSWGDAVILYNFTSSSIKVDAGINAQNTITCSNGKHKIIFNYDSSTNDFTLYVDNIANKVTVNNTKFGVSKNLLTNKSAKQSFIGGIEYIKIYNKMLSNDEISSLFSN